MVTFYQFPREHWVHLRTVNVVESPLAALRLRTDAAKRYKRCDRATAVISKMLLVAERRFRRLNARTSSRRSTRECGTWMESWLPGRSPPDGKVHTS